MGLTAAGVSNLAALAVGSGVAFNSANARIGVGNGNIAEDATQTDLVGSSKYRQAMDPEYPKVTGSTMSFKSTFAPGVANFDWLEWGIFNAASGGTMLCRVLENNGTKLSNQTWILEIDVTLQVAQ